MAAELNTFINSFWSLVPPLVAIVLALITKEVYSSLFVGILTGALFYNKFNLVGTVDTIVQDGLIASVTGTAGNFIFLAVLGALIVLIRKFGDYPEGVTYAILLMNICAPLLDRVMPEKLYGYSKAKKKEAKA